MADQTLDLGPDLDPDYEQILETAAAAGAPPADVDTARALLNIQEWREEDVPWSHIAKLFRVYATYVRAGPFDAAEREGRLADLEAQIAAAERRAREEEG